MNRFGDDEIRHELQRHPGWSFDGSALLRTFDCRTFDGSIRFVNRVAALANELDHHPDLALSWNEVVIRSWSHDIAGISARDFALVAAIDAIAEP